MTLYVKFQTGLLWQNTQHNEWIFSDIMENDKKLGKFILEMEHKERLNS